MDFKAESLGEMHICKDLCIRWTAANALDFRVIYKFHSIMHVIKFRFGVIQANQRQFGYKNVKLYNIMPLILCW